MAALILANAPLHAEEGDMLTIDDCGSSALTEDISYTESISSGDGSLIYISDSGSLEGVDHDISLNLTFTEESATYTAIKIVGEDASMGGLVEGSSLTITASRSTDEGVNDVYGIVCESGSIGNIDGDISVITSGNVNAYGIYTSSSDSLGTISGSITTILDSKNRESYAIYFSDSKTANEITFAAGAEITSSRDDYVGYAIYSMGGLTLNVENYCASSEAVSLFGNIRSAGDVYFETGNYILTMHTYYGDSLTFSQNSSVVLTGNPSESSSFGLIITTADFIFELNTDVNGAILTITENTYFYSAAVTDIYIRLSDELYAQYEDLILAEDWASIDFNVIAVESELTLACFENDNFVLTNEDGTVTYASGLSNSDCNFVTLLSSDSDFGTIPEPTTSTLSLLTLAALLSRRHRSQRA